MKNIILTTILFILSFAINAQDILGKWNGVLDVMGQQMPLSFNISNSLDGLTATMDSPSEKAFGIPLSSIEFNDPELKISHDAIGMLYIGQLNAEGIIEGDFNQNGYSFPLNLSREEVEIKAALRPQEPKEPFSYYTEEVVFPNQEHTLAGTLSLPNKEGKYAVVILVSGSGPQDRDESLVGHKPFLVLADYLTRNGIGVLRYDDRGIAKSTGEFKGATTFDFASDAEAAYLYLRSRKDINKKKIAVMGHSEGGLIAPMVAADNKKLDAIVLLAGPGISLGELLIQQQEDISQASGISEEEIKNQSELVQNVYALLDQNYTDEKIKQEMDRVFDQFLSDNPDFEIPMGMDQEEFKNMQKEQLLEPWFRTLLSIDPAVSLSKVKCPVFAINGGKDLQVKSKENLDAIQSVLAEGGNKDVTTMEFDNLNHLFQNCETGSPDEYGLIEETFAPEALEAILNWLRERGY